MSRRSRRVALRATVAVLTATATLAAPTLAVAAPAPFAVTANAQEVSVPQPVVSVTGPFAVNGTQPVDVSEHAGSVADLDTGSIAVSFHVSSTSAAQALISWSSRSSTAANLSLTVNRGHLYFEVRDGQRSYVTRADAEDADRLDDGQLHTAVVTVEEGQTRIYLDGQQRFSTTGSGFFDDVSGADTLMLGANRSASGTQWVFNGTIENASVYDEVLDLAQVQALSPLPQPSDSAQSDTISLSAESRDALTNRKVSLLVDDITPGGSVVLRRGSTAVSIVELHPSTLTIRQGGQRLDFPGNWLLNPPDSIAVTFSGSTVSVYVDGSFIGTGQLDGRSLPTVDSLDASQAAARLIPTVVSEAQIQSITGHDSIAEKAVFDSGFAGAASYRIPTLLKTSAGTLLAAADQRVPSAADSPNDINLSLRRSLDNGATWEPLNVLIDLPGTGKQAASVIDSVLVQDRSSGRITAIVDLFPGGIGQPNNKLGTGMDDEGRLLLHHADGRIFVVEADGTVLTNDGETTDYLVDEDGTLRLSGVALGSIYNSAAEQRTIPDLLIMFPTSYMVRLHSDDDGLTWSTPRIISGIKEPWMKFIGTGPGAAIQLQGGLHDGRLIVPIYYSNETGRVYSSAVIYSDDGGESWTRGQSPNDGRSFQGQVWNSRTATDRRFSLHESVAVQTGSDEITLFMRNLNPGQALGIARSTDGGETFSEPIFDATVPEIFSQPNALSLTDHSREVIFANASARLPYRGRGVVRYSPDAGRNWEHARTFRSGHYVYQSMVMLDDNTIGLLWEREWQGIYFSTIPLSWLTSYGATSIGPR